MVDDVDLVNFGVIIGWSVVVRSKAQAETLPLVS